MNLTGKILMDASNSLPFKVFFGQGQRTHFEPLDHRNLHRAQDPRKIFEDEHMPGRFNA